MDAKTKNRLADKLNDAIGVIEEVIAAIEQDKTADTSERQIARVLQTGPIASLNANSVILRGKVVSTT
jgi:hypothetical protein